MKKLGMFILVLAVALFFVSCTISLDGNENGGNHEIVIKTFVDNAQESIYFFAYKDGKDGNWTKLTSTNGKYTFTPQSSDGNYSIYAVHSCYLESVGENEYDIRILNLNKDEGSEIQLYFNTYAYAYDESPEATLMLNFSNDFLEKWAGAYWGKCHGFYDFDNPAYLTNNEVYGVMPGTNDLVILLGDSINQGEYWSRGFINKIFIERGFTISEGEQEFNPSLNEFVDIETFSATTTIQDADVWCELLVGGTTNVFTWELPPYTYVKIPSSLKSPKDLYTLSLSSNTYVEDYVAFLGFMVCKSYPNDTETLNTLPSSNWERPICSEYTVSWKPYYPDIPNQEVRFYETCVLSNYFYWDIVLSAKWLGSADTYEYELPKLEGLEDWNELWYPKISETGFQYFKAIAGNKQDFREYFVKPTAGLEASYFEIH